MSFSSSLGFYTSGVSGNARIKEKLIKIIQYYNQFLIGYYTYYENSPNGLSKALQAQAVLSTCRKSIRFLKWIVHIQNAVENYEEIKRITDAGGVVKSYKYFDLINDLCNATYFLGDNRALFVNCGLLQRNIFIENCLYTGDFCADLSNIISAILQLHDIPSEERKLQNRKQEIIMRIKSSIGIVEGKLREEYKNVQESLKALMYQRKEARFQLVGSLLQLISSANYDPICLWRRIFGKKCSDTIVGISGVISSGVIIYHQWSSTLDNEEEGEDTVNRRAQIGTNCLSNGNSNLQDGIICAKDTIK